MNLWMLALRNLLRNRRRSLATLLAMVVGLTAILLFGGYRSNILYGMETGFVQFSGHLQVQRRGYFVMGATTPRPTALRATSASSMPSPTTRNWRPCCAW